MFGGCVGRKYNVEIFLSCIFHQFAYRSEVAPGELAMVLKTRVLMNFSAFRDFYALKIRGLDFLPPKP